MTRMYSSDSNDNSNPDSRRHRIGAWAGLRHKTLAQIGKVTLCIAERLTRPAARRMLPRGARKRTAHAEGRLPIDVTDHVTRSSVALVEAEAELAIIRAAAYDARETMLRATLDADALIEAFESVRRAQRAIASAHSWLEKAKAVQSGVDSSDLPEHAGSAEEHIKARSAALDQATNYFAAFTSWLATKIAHVPHGPTEEGGATQR